MVRKPIVCFDIDGVLLAGHTPIPKASEALRLLKNHKIPYMFLTNGSPCTEVERIRQLDEALGTESGDSLMLMAQTPLSEMTDLHHKNVLFIGSLDLRKTVTSLGFKNPILIEEIADRYPLLDAVNKGIDLTKVIPKGTVPTIEAIVIMDDPNNYETSIQLIADVIFTQGTLDHSIEKYPIVDDPIEMFNKVPVFVMCTDFLWTTTAPWPRLAAGVFLHFLENYIETFCGHPLKYKAIYGKPYIDAYIFLYKQLCQKFGPDYINDIYFIGDNLLTDIYGANTFKRQWEYIGLDPIKSPLNIKSMLVRTGVYKGEPIESCKPQLKFLHPSTQKDCSLLYPDHIFKDAFEAAQHIANLHLS